ncbi:MAG TPA: glycoside hydrolase family 2 TIM barrel-domain containing protein [Tepidisphaeraceae bacterium]|jgi:hypothetical protein|nr:glycoside hydrolase family 2 TIM barrel-domain containing protein [Tepidisphaeraceae bacterium]
MFRSTTMAMLLTVPFITATARAGRVEVTVRDRQASLVVDGRPFQVQGVTFGVSIDDPDRLDAAFKDLKFLGVNAIRTWDTEERSALLLDAAERHGIKVVLGLWLRHGRPGAEGDDSFDWVSDEAGRQAQLDRTLATVQRFKDHPALLMWGVGNEVILNIATEPAKLAYAKFLGSLCREIKAIDRDHPVMSVEAWTIGWQYWADHAADVDVYGTNVYGPGAGVLDGEHKRMGMTKPYLISEFGVRGEWDAPKDQNGLEIEPNDKEKYDAIATGYREWIRPQPMCLGAFVFHYGDNDDHAAVWLSTRVAGLTRPAYWGIYKAYRNREPAARFPAITSFKASQNAARVGQWLPIELTTQGSKDALEISFRFNRRASGTTRKERDEILDLQSRGSRAAGYEIKVPDHPGVIKIYAYVKDKHDNLAIAQQSIVVERSED